MYSEERNELEYKKIPLYIRVLLRINILFLHILAVLLAKYNISPAVTLIKHPDPKPDLKIIKDEEEETLQ